MATKTCKLEGQRCLCVHQESCSCWFGILSTLDELKAASAGGAAIPLHTCPDHPCSGSPGKGLCLPCPNNSTPSPGHQGASPAVGTTVMMRNGNGDGGECCPVCLSECAAQGKGQDKRFLSGNVSAASTATGETHKNSDMFCRAVS